MSRTLLALGAALLAFTPAHAADPLPLWEIDTGTEQKQVPVVSWVGFSPDGKQLVARNESGHLENPVVTYLRCTAG